MIALNGHPGINKLAKVEVRRVTIIRAEGLVEQCDRPETFLGPEALFFAGRRLGEWAYNAPAEGGYDKCDFKVEWMDGKTYDGRADIERQHYTAPRGYDLAEHMRSFLEFMGGRWTRERVTAHYNADRRGTPLCPEECWARYQNFVDLNEVRDASCKLLDLYSLGSF